MVVVVPTHHAIDIYANRLHVSEIAITASVHNTWYINIEQSINSPKARYRRRGVGHSEKGLDLPGGPGPGRECDDPSQRSVSGANKSGAVAAAGTNAAAAPVCIGGAASRPRHLEGAHDEEAQRRLKPFQSHPLRLIAVHH